MITIGENTKFDDDVEFYGDVEFRGDCIVYGKIITNETLLKYKYKDVEIKSKWDLIKALFSVEFGDNKR